MKGQKKQIFCNALWWILPLLLCVCMIALIFLFTTVPSFFESIISILFLLVVISLLASWVMLLINKRWWQCIASFAMSSIIIIVLWLPLVLSAMSGPDGFGRKHKIPDDLEYQLPLDSSQHEGMQVDSLDSNSYLQVWNGIQGGIYTYDFFYPSLPDGTIFLRCYEATEDLPLSEDRLPEQSSVYVEATDHFSQLVNQKEFTIYEGDWEDYYAARIEVWFRDTATKQERKLYEKIYRVEGWMR